MTVTIRIPLFLRRMSATKNSSDFMYRCMRGTSPESFKSILLLVKLGRAAGPSVKRPGLRIFDISRFGALLGPRSSAAPLLLTDESGGISRVLDMFASRGNSGCFGPPGPRRRINVRCVGTCLFRRQPLHYPAFEVNGLRRVPPFKLVQEGREYRRLV